MLGELVAHFALSADPLHRGVLRIVAEARLIQGILVNGLDSVQLLLPAMVLPWMSRLELCYLRISPQLRLEPDHLEVLFLPCPFDEMVDAVGVPVPVEIDHRVGPGAPAGGRPFLFGVSLIEEFSALVEWWLGHVGVVLHWHVTGRFAFSGEGLNHGRSQLLLGLG